MTLTIQQFIEALTNSEGRFRTLERVYPVMDGEKTPVFTVPCNWLVDFEVYAAGRRMTLRCPLLDSPSDRIRIQALAAIDEGLGSEFYSGWRLLESEVALFDWWGAVTEADILCRPAAEGVPAVDFLQEASAAGDVALILDALKSFARFADWLESIGREGAPAGNLRFTADGKVRLTGFSACCEMPRVALALFFAAAMPGAYPVMIRPLLVRSPEAVPSAVRMCLACAALGVSQPELVLAGDLGEPLALLADYTPARVAVLGSRLSEMLSSDASAGSGFAWESDGKVSCVRDNGGWNYFGGADRPALGALRFGASSFREGRAVVETDEGRGLIDREGIYVLEPVYEEVVWDEYWGLVAVMAEGRWSLLDRDGAPLTRIGYDWLGECSEGFILSQKDGKCGFLDTKGCEAIPFVFDDASSFFEGSAQVTVGRESYLIGPDGVRRPST